MTLREKLADWISGGKLTEARNGLADARIELEIRRNELRHAYDFWDVAETTVRDILVATEHGKSGTAKKIARMAREGLR
jgi:hypothetical protein